MSSNVKYLPFYLFLPAAFLTAFCASPKYDQSLCSATEGPCPGIELFENADGLYGYRNPETGVTYIEPRYVMATGFEAPYKTAFVVLDGQWHCIDTAGRVKQTVFTYDNGPDYLVNGYRRYVSKDKMGYIDAWCNVAEKAVYDFAWPVQEDGSADVCTGCRINRTNDEHSTVTGGKNFQIKVSGP